MNEEEIDELGFMLEDKGLTHSQIDDYFEHVGVKGMKWGVRRNRRTAQLQRAGAANSDAASRLRALKRLGPVDLVRGGGIRGGARRKSIRESDRAKRLANGKGTVKDHLIRVGSTRAQDIIPVRESAVKKTQNSKFWTNDKAVLAAGGAVFVGKILVKNAAKKKL